MFVRSYYDVLIVDDEPDVLAVSRLALKNVRVFGIPLKIHECTGRADAIRFMQATAELSDLALAIIDVVMDTENAGLDVCKFIREDLGNRVTPIVVRTGQAGKAPEREVIERYDISTYLTKVEATHEKLQATAINAIRNYQYARVHEAALGAASRIIRMGETREGIVRGIPEFIRNLVRRRDGAVLESGQFHFCFLTGREAIAVGNFVGREAEARAARDRLAGEPSKVVNASGDRVMQAGDHLLISLATTENAPAFDLICESNFHPLPDFAIRPIATFAQCVRDQLLLADKRR